MFRIVAEATVEVLTVEGSRGPLRPGLWSRRNRLSGAEIKVTRLKYVRRKYTCIVEKKINWESAGRRIERPIRDAANPNKHGKRQGPCFSVCM